MFAGAGMMAADGRCKTLDAAADGYVRGEACVVIKLRYGCEFTWSLLLQYAQSVI
jgi:Beta-ketoacyl synthase, N-terminal domain